MGQLIEVHATRLGEVTIFATDRTLGGQDGESFESAADAEQSETWPARLAAQLWAADPDISGVFVLSNTISVERTEGWTEDVVDTSSNIIRNLFVHYDENRDE